MRLRHVATFCMRESQAVGRRAAPSASSLVCPGSGGRPPRGLVAPSSGLNGRGGLAWLQQRRGDKEGEKGLRGSRAKSAPAGARQQLRRSAPSHQHPGPLCRLAFREQRWNVQRCGSQARPAHRWLRAAARSIWRRNDLQAWQLQLSTPPRASRSSCPARPQAQWNHLRQRAQRGRERRRRLSSSGSSTRAPAAAPMRHALWAEP